MTEVGTDPRVDAVAAEYHWIETAREWADLNEGQRSVWRYLARRLLRKSDDADLTIQHASAVMRENLELRAEVELLHAQLREAAKG